MGNIFGTLFRLSTFGESHGKAIGAVIDGCPAGVNIDLEVIQQELIRRRPGQSSITTARDEKDKVEILSGIFKGQSLGTPISLLIMNKDQHSEDYNNLSDIYRPGHADFTYQQKYKIRDWRGGGRSSNRESAARVAAGAIAKQLIYQVAKIDILAWVSQVKDITGKINPETVTLKQVESNIVRCPNQKIAEKMQTLIQEAKTKGDSLGGTVSFRIKNTPAGLGSPVFDKLTADMAKALISINATRSFEIGIGSESITLSGSEHNDEFIVKNNKVTTKTNNVGGVLGGISNGNTIFGKINFKPTSTILSTQKTVNKKMEAIKFTAQGRHDPCVLPRAVPIVEAMLNLCIADHLMLAVSSNLENLKKIFN